MTSRHSFSKILKLDLKHKIWMLALSILGNILALPVAYAIYSNSDRHSYYSNDGLQYVTKLENIETFMKIGMPITSLVILIAGAFIVGICGFRFLFHKNMVDTWHGMPIKRKTIFMVNWLNGFLIWFVPFIVTSVLTTAIAAADTAKQISLGKKVVVAAYYKTVINQCSVGNIVGIGFLNILLLVIAFLLIYNMVIVAVMLCGNAINAFVEAMLIGTGAAALTGLTIVYMAAYYHSYVANYSDAIRRILYLSPIASGVYMMNEAFTGFNGGMNVKMLILQTVTNLVIAVLLGFGAYRLYLHRPSELAEQGIKSKAVRAINQFVFTVIGSFLGWGFFYFIDSVFLSTSEGSDFWCGFGAVLFGVLVYGICGILYNMEGKAFFKHKIGMAVSVAAGLLALLCIRCDLFGYDSYIPEESKIKEISVFFPEASNRNIYYDITNADHPMNNTHITDTKLAHEFLEAAVDSTLNNSENDRTVEIAETDTSDSKFTVGENSDNRYSLTAYAKVTLSNNKVYYREYSVQPKYEDLVYKIIATEEYLAAEYLFNEEQIEEMVQNVNTVTFENINANTSVGDRAKNEQIIRKVLQAYNEDILENSEAFVRDQGRRLSTINCDFDEGTIRYLTLSITDKMPHVRQALTELGYEKYTNAADAESIKSVDLIVYLYGDDIMNYTAGDVLNDIEINYGITISSEQRVKILQEVGITEDTPVKKESRYNRYDCFIEDEEEIAELLDYIAVSYYRQGTVWSEYSWPSTEIYVMRNDNDQYYCIFKAGVLQEKYIVRILEQLTK